MDAPGPPSKGRRRPRVAGGPEAAARILLCGQPLRPLARRAPLGRPGVRTAVPPHPSAEGVHITIMLRTDCFKGARSRGMRQVAKPPEVYYAVNKAVAARIASVPLAFPTLAECQSRVAPQP